MQEGVNAFEWGSEAPAAAVSGLEDGCSSSLSLEVVKNGSSASALKGCNYHLMLDLTVGCGLGTIGRFVFWDATKSGKLLSTWIRVPNGAPDCATCLAKSANVLHNEFDRN